MQFPGSPKPPSLSVEIVPKVRLHVAGPPSRPFLPQYGWVRAHPHRSLARTWKQGTQYRIVPVKFLQPDKVARNEIPRDMLRERRVVLQERRVRGPVNRPLVIAQLAACEFNATQPTMPSAHKGHEKHETSVPRSSGDRHRFRSGAGHY